VWSFFWACPGEDAHFLGRGRSLAHCQAQSLLGLVSAKPARLH